MEYAYSFLEPLVEDLFFCCSDPRCVEAFEEFPKKELGLRQGQYTTIRAFGGLASLAHRLERIHDYECMADQILLGLKCNSSLKRIHVIAHHGCKYYAEHNLGDQHNTEREKFDLPAIKKAVDTIAKGDIVVLGYYARFTRYRTVLIESVKL
jgi:hypothetical protein